MLMLSVTWQARWATLSRSLSDRLSSCTVSNSPSCWVSAENSLLPLIARCRSSTSVKSACTDSASDLSYKEWYNWIWYVKESQYPTRHCLLQFPDILSANNSIKYNDCVYLGSCILGVLLTRLICVCRQICGRFYVLWQWSPWDQCQCSDFISVDTCY